MDERYLSRPEPGVIRAAEAIDEALSTFDGRYAARTPEAVYLDAAEAVAIIALVIEQVRTDPSYVAARGVREDALRRKAFEAALSRFHAASEAFHAERAVAS